MLSANRCQSVYNTHSPTPFAEDMGYHGEPFRWEEIRRAQLRAELDAYYAHLYGLTRDELRYILEPKEVHGEDFPAETFCLKKCDNGDDCRSGYICINPETFGSSDRNGDLFFSAVLFGTFMLITKPTEKKIAKLA